jgi:DeoR family fructose operon transcriptional repressor
MLAEERRLQIVDWTRAEGRLDATEAALKLNVASETVRRDLDVLERRGVLRRVHGGAISVDRFAHEFTLPERLGKPYLSWEFKPTTMMWSASRPLDK